MWMPEQIAEQGPLLKTLGVENPEIFGDPLKMSHIASLGFCSASFLSNSAKGSGLAITNHHCVAGMLNYMTQAEKKENPNSTADYGRSGFYAATQEEERSAGPAQFMYVTQSLEDVTHTVNAGLLAIADPIARGKQQEENVKALIKEAEAGQKDIRAEVKSYFEGERFYLIKKLRIQDVRVVYVPNIQIGNFGGDTDNWHWPRQVGDFAWIRAYVAPDGSSRGYDKDNVPYVPTSILTIEPNGVKEGDLTLVAGYPGHTDRLRTAGDVRWDATQYKPYVLAKYGSFLPFLEALGKEKEEWRLKLDSKIKSFHNTVKKFQSEKSALERIGFLEEKERNQKEIERWAAGYSKFAGSIKKMEAMEADLRKDWLEFEVYNNFGENAIAGIVQIFASSITIVRMAQERPKADADRHPDYQKRNWEDIRKKETDSQSRYDSELSQRVLHWVITRAVSLPDNKIPAFIQMIVPDVAKARISADYITKKIRHLYSHTQLENLETRLALFNTASLKKLKSSSDPMIKIALQLAVLKRQQDDKGRRASGLSLEVAPKYIETVRAYARSKEQLLAPDANSTLRITFGHVEGCTSPLTTEWKAPFTDVASLILKHKAGDAEFEVSQKIRDVVEATPAFGKVPVDFLATLDTTGGNSGSAAMNTKGHLVGLLFDGTDETLYSDFVFKGEEVRSILVGTPYILWVMKYIDHTDRLLEEIGLSHWEWK